MELVVAVTVAIVAIEAIRRLSAQREPIRVPARIERSRRRR
jgi:hypothetical protein